MSVATRTVPGVAASNGANPPDGRHGAPDAAKTTSVGDTRERLEPGPLEQLLDRGGARQATRSEQGTREPVRCGRSCERPLHRLLRAAVE